MNRCDVENRLTPFLLGELPEQDMAAMQRHLETCAACRETARELTSVLQPLAAGLARDRDAHPRLDPLRRQAVLCVPPRVISAPRVLTWAARPRPWLLAAASILALLVLSAMLFPATMGSVKAGKRAHARLGLDLASARIETIASQREQPFPSNPSDRTDLSYFTYGKGEAGAAPAGTPAAASVTYGGGADGMLVGGQSHALDPFAAPVPAAAPVVVEGRQVLSARILGTTVNNLAKDKLRTQHAAEALSGNGLKGLAADSYKPEEAPSDSAYRFKRANVDADTDHRWASATEQSQKEEERAAQSRPDKAIQSIIRKSVMRDEKLSTDDGRLRAAGEMNGTTVSAPAGVGSAGAAAESGKDMYFGDRVDTSRASKIREPLTKPAAPVSAAIVGYNTILLTKASASSLSSPIPPAPPEPAESRPVRRPTPPSFNPFVNTVENRFSTFAIDVSTASYNLMRQALRSGALPAPDTVRTEAILNAFDYGDAAPDRAMFRVYLEGAPSAFGAPGLTLLRIGVKGKRMGREEQRPAMLTFLIDTSGSMSEPDRIGRARTALRLLLDRLAPTDKLQIVSFDDKARIVLAPTAATRKADILKAFDRLQCNGSTNLEDGMRRAYQQAARAFVPGGENRVILITDGVANLGSDNAQDILKQVDEFRRQGITSSVFGVGEGAYNDALLADLADKGQGVYRFLDSDAEAQRVFVDDLAATLNNIATDVKIQVEWSPAAVRRFRQLGYERRALAAEQFRDDTVEAGQVGSGQAVTALYELELSPAARQAPLGTVRVRYRRADTGAIEEFAQEIVPETMAAAAGLTRPQFRVAMCAAAFAEKLRGSPYMVSDYANVIRLLNPVVQELSIDPRAGELLSLVTAAEALSK